MRVQVQVPAGPTRTSALRVESGLGTRFCDESESDPISTLASGTPSPFFFSPLRWRHKKKGLGSVAARPPYRPYLGPWMELEDDQTFHPISLRLALPVGSKFS